jgi:peptidyl-prolyl cis-trans isomerase B (cyclophilin B)
MRREALTWLRWCAVLALVVALPTLTAAQEETEGAAEDSLAVGGPAAEGGTRVAISVSVEGEDGKMTGLGTFVIELYPEDAPQHVENFLKLVREKYFEGTTFHRLVPGFIIQGGDPISRSDWRSPKVGTGGPTYTVPAEIGRKHVRGAVAAARKPDAVNPNRESSGSQFYISLADLPALDRGGYTVFGMVVEGMDVVDKIARVRNAGSASHNRALQRVEMTEVKILP